MKNVSSLRLFTSLMHDENIKLFMAACEFVCLYFVGFNENPYICNNTN